MASDSFYNSSQGDLEIEYQIDLFEIRQYSKLKKPKMKISSYPFSMKSRRSAHPLIKIYGMNDRRTPAIEEQLFRYNRYSEKNKEEQSAYFECDQQYRIQSDTPPDLSLKGETLENFGNFRQQFYHANHQRIKSSFNDQPGMEILNIRLAPIEKSVQDDFMKNLKENSSYFPHLVYHGTRLDSMKSILDYGFLIPNQTHPTNTKAPVISTQNGSAYGSGIYCSETANYSLSYLRNSNTLLACAAVPRRDDSGHVQRSHGNILVLSHVSEIIPIFLVDFRYLSGSNTNQSWFERQYKRHIRVEKDPNKPLIISKKYLRKVLNCMKDDVQRIKRYRRRKNNRKNVRWDEEYSVRLFEPLDEKYLL